MPIDLLTVWKGREVWRSLETDSYAMALRRIHRIAADVESEFEKTRVSMGRLADPALIVTTLDDPPISLPWGSAAPQPPTPSLPSSTRTIGDVYDRFIADPKHQWSKRTQIAHATTRKWVVEVFGEETALTDITREGCRDFVALLREMPKSAHQRFPDMTIKAVVTAAKARGEARLISTANLNAYVNRFGGVMNWAINEGYLDRNPLKGLKLPDP